MSGSKLRTQSMDLAVSIINLVKDLKEKREAILSNQIGRSGTSIGANICEVMLIDKKGMSQNAYVGNDLCVIPKEILRNTQMGNGTLAVPYDKT